MAEGRGGLDHCGWALAEVDMEWKKIRLAWPLRKEVGLNTLRWKT